MTGLSDLFASPTTVTIGDKQIEVVALTIEQIGKLLARFEVLRQQIASADAAKLDAVSMLSKIGVEAASAIIAAGTGKPGDAAQEAAAAKLAFGVQVDLIDAIVTATLPSGDGPLARQLLAFGKSFAGAASQLLAASTTASSLQPPPPSG